MHGLNLIFERQHFTPIFLIAVFIILGTILESLSIGLIFPILSLLFDPASDQKIYLFSFLYENLNFLNFENKIVFYLIFFLIIYVIKIFFLVFFSWYTNKFGWDLHNHLSKKVYKKYLEQNIEFFKSKNTGNIIRDLTSEIAFLISSGLSPAIILISNFFILCGFMTVLLLVNLKITLIIFSITLLVSFIFIILNRPFLLKWGKMRQENEGNRIHILNQGVNSIKEAKIYGKELWFLNKFHFYNVLHYNSLRNYDFFKTLPRHLIELIILIFVISIIIFFYNQNSIDELLPFFGVLFVGFFRTIPIISNMLRSIQSISYTRISYKLIVDALNMESKELISNQIIPKLEFNKIINIKNLKFSYKNSEKIILNNINLEIRKNDCIGIIGESGAGKSTFIDVLMGLNKPTKGEITLDDVNILQNRRSWQKMIGYVPQSIYLIDESIKKNIAFGEDDVNIGKLNQVLKQSGLEQFVENLANKENTIIGEKGAKISGGERQRIAIARSLYKNPDLIIFDEATSSLDLETEKKVLETIKHLKEEKTLIIISHRMNTLNYCNKIYELKDGNLFLKPKA